MKIALVSTFVPFVKGGYRNIVEWLEHALRNNGHQVEIVYLPEVDEPASLFQQMAAFRWVDLSSADRVICFRPQAHLIQHRHKILWFIHHIRGFYDLWDNDLYRGCPDDDKHRGFRKALHETDTAAIMEAKHVFTNSKVVSERLKHFNKVDSEVLYPPVFQPERFFCRRFNDEIVYVCRLENHKRQTLLIDALALTKTPVRVRICGTSSDPAYVNGLRAQIASLGVQRRVVLEDRWISEEEKTEILADCLAAAYLPVDEDSYGYPSVEASHASKAIITTQDSGGVLELVVDGVNGFVCEPNPAALAKVMDQLFNDRHLARTLGEKAHNRLDEIRISWSHVIERLLA
jgi:glycosyltransferase involved in cell wall biosynthesis